jgi:hypothetical protein
MRLTIYLEEHGDETATATFDLDAYSLKHDGPTLVGAAIRNMLRDQRALSFEPLKAFKAAKTEEARDAACKDAGVSDGCSEETVASACKAAWVKAARERLAGWMKDGYRPGGGGSPVSEWVKLARVKLAATFAKRGVKGDTELNGLTLAAVRKASEADLRAYVGEQTAAKWDAEMAEDDGLFE